jgi:GntR family transcriptional regulator
MVLRIDPSSGVSICRQIVNQLRVALVNSALAPGDSLPPVRRLALDLGTHFNTVAEAYRELAAEGWLEIGARKGTRVVKRIKTGKTRPGAGLAFREEIAFLVAKTLADGISPSQLERDLREVLAQLEKGYPCLCK